MSRVLTLSRKLKVSTSPAAKLEATLFAFLPKPCLHQRVGGLTG